jgi:small-conductance mechanosensitive channel
MESYKIQLIQTLLVISGYIGAFYINKSLIEKVLKKALLPRARRKIIVRAFNLLTTITALVFIAAIWGLRQSEIAVFVSTIITAIGIAFFAQWSLLSNITSSILIFFNHPMKIGDHIKVMDKEFPFEGEITDLSYFFVYIKTNSGELITLPNSLVLQKSISIVSSKEVDIGKEL